VKGAKKRYHSDSSYRKKITAYNSKVRREKKTKNPLYRDKIINSMNIYRHGITSEEKNRMIQSQDGKCMICKQTFRSAASTHLDHDHLTKQIRDVLCNKCNLMLGLANDIPERLEAASQYLRKWGK
jgi:hypothetical protein